MSPAPVDELLRAALRATPPPGPVEVAAARARLLARVDRRRRRVRTGLTLAALAVVGAGLAGVAVVRLPASGPPDAATGPSPAPTAATGVLPSATPTFAPVGDPLPARLRGAWSASAMVEGVATTATLALGADTYRLCTGPSGCLDGRVAVRDGQMEFSEERWCGLSGPAGAARYAWSLEAGSLDLTPVGPDPCFRSPLLGEAAWQRG